MRKLWMLKKHVEDAAFTSGRYEGYYNDPVYSPTLGKEIVTLVIGSEVAGPVRVEIVEENSGFYLLLPDDAYEKLKISTGNPSLAVIKQHGPGKARVIV